DYYCQSFDSSVFVLF
nr:immunoglobulin light chain junction region [Macaca mulatta]